MTIAPLAPLAERMRGYRREWLPGDILAGLLVAALAIPQSLGYAAVAGVPVQVGLFTLPPALLIYALVGTSRVLYVGPVSTVTVVTGSVVRGLADGDPVRATSLTAALALAAGLVLVIAGLMRVGWVAQFLNAPIVSGFVTGLVVLIVVGETPALIGLDHVTGTLLDRVVAIASALTTPLTTMHFETTVTGVAALAILLIGNARLPRVPWSLLVLLGGISLSHALDLPNHGVPVVGAVQGGLPLPSLPSITVSDLGPIMTGALAVAGIGIAEGLAAARAFAHGTERRVMRDDRELIANGLADIGSGLFGGMAVAGSLSKTAANARAGARTQFSSVVSAVAVLGVLLFATGSLAALPKAVLSAIVIAAVWSLVHPEDFARYRAVRRNDGIAALVALGGVLVLGPMGGMLLAVGQSLLGLIYRTMQVSIDEMGKVAGEKAAWGAVAHDPTRATVDGIMVLRPDAPIFWANASDVFARIDAMVRSDTRTLLLDLEATNQFDTTTADRLNLLINDLRERGVDVHLVRVFGNVREVLERTGILELIGEDHLWHSISAAVKSARQDLETMAGAPVLTPELRAALQRVPPDVIAGFVPEIDLVERLLSEYPTQEDGDTDDERIVPKPHKESSEKHGTSATSMKKPPKK